MKKNNVAVIGCGRIAGHHCRNIVGNPRLHLSAVCDLEFEKATAYGKEFSVPAYKDYREMLKTHPEIELVAVITPSATDATAADELLHATGLARVSPAADSTFACNARLCPAISLTVRGSTETVAAGPGTTTTLTVDITGFSPGTMALTVTGIVETAPADTSPLSLTTPSNRPPPCWNLITAFDTGFPAASTA